MKNRKLALLGIVCAVMGASINCAKAVQFPLPAINLGVGDQHEFGQVLPGISEGDAQITQYVNFMVGLPIGGSGHLISDSHDKLVSRSMNEFGSLVGLTSLARRGDTMTIDLGTQRRYDYLFAHYGGPSGGALQVWSIDALNGIITIPATAFDHDLSGWALLGPSPVNVPDSGATVTLLLASLGAIAVMRRYLLIS